MNHQSINGESLEHILFEFEQAWFDNRETRIEQFLPADSSSNFVEVLTELVRSEMELRLESVGVTPAEEYFRRFPLLAQDETAKKAIVFEEYRLRHGAGERISQESVLGRYGMESADWPKLGAGVPSPASTTVPGISRSTAKASLKFPKVGDTVGDFELVGQLGDGAFGRVYLAQQGELAGRLVVLKFTSRKTDEHRLLARLQHTNIVPIHSVHRFDDLQAICMPLLGVATLDDILRYIGKAGPDRVAIPSNALVQTVNRHREKTVVDTINDQDNAQYFQARQRPSSDPAPTDSNPSMPEFAANFVQQMAEGLGYAHQRGIVHGDLKPANLLVNDDGQPVILDFHLGFSQEENFGSMIGGTLPYMAPEHLLAMSQNDIELQPTMDVYSTGVILYQMLTGRLPFEDELNSMLSLEQLANSKSERFTLSADDRRMFGEDLAAITQTCLEPRPENRFANGTELAAELQRSLANQPLRIADNGSLGNRIAKWANRNPRLSSGSTILAVCSLIIVGIGMALWAVNSRLSHLNAISASTDRIASAESIGPILATADFQRDPSFFESAIQQGESLIETNGWSTPGKFRSASGLRRLDDAMVSHESMTAATIHFWIAENCRHAARYGDQGEFLRQADEHNNLAQQFWPQQPSRVALNLQQLLIAAGIDGSKPNADKMASFGRPDNASDTAMSVHLQPQDIGQKRNEYLKLVEGDKDNFQNWLLLGNASAASNDLEQAESWYTVCISMDPDSYLPYLYRGLSRHEQGKIKLAVEDLERAIQMEPDDITILLNYGLALGKNREFENALAIYDRAIELGAHQTRTWLLRSQLKNALGDKAGAQADLLKFMELEPTDEKSWITRGIQKIKEQPKEAIEDFQVALVYNPQSKDALNNIAHVYSEILGDTETAIEYMDQVVALDKSNPTLVASRGVLQARIGRLLPATADAEAALRLDRSADTCYRVAGIYAQLSKRDEKYIELATALLARAAFENPGLVRKMRETDPDIVPLRGNEGFESIFESISGLEAHINKKSENK